MLYKDSMGPPSLRYINYRVSDFKKHLMKGAGEPSFAYISYPFVETYHRSYSKKSRDNSNRSIVHLIINDTVSYLIEQIYTKWGGGGSQNDFNEKISYAIVNKLTLPNINKHHENIHLQK